MTYRDDREAMHQRVQQLESDLERAQSEAQAEAAGRSEAQAQVEQLRKALARAQQELERLKPPEPTPDAAARRRKAVAVAVVAATVFLIGGGMAAFLLVARPADQVQVPPPGTVPAPVPVPAVPAAPVPEAEPRAEEPAAEPEIDGSLDRAAIQRVIRRNIGQVRHCYERGLQDRPGLGGVVKVRFTIGATGGVTATSIVSSTLKSSKVETCILAAVRRWKFAAPKQSPVSIVYPFVFRTAGQ